MTEPGKFHSCRQDTRPDEQLIRPWSLPQEGAGGDLPDPGFGTMDDLQMASIRASRSPGGVPLHGSGHHRTASTGRKLNMLAVGYRSRWHGFRGTDRGRSEDGVYGAQYINLADSQGCPSGQRMSMPCGAIKIPVGFHAPTTSAAQSAIHWRRSGGTLCGRKPEALAVPATRKQTLVAALKRGFPRKSTFRHP